MNKANRKKFLVSAGANIRIGTFFELIDSLGKPRPPEKVFVRADGVRIHFCASPTVYGDEEFNRHVRPTLRAKAAEWEDNESADP